MPELELCSRCGKQVLIARYPWSRNKALCRICSELNIQQESSSKDIKISQGSISNRFQSSIDSSNPKSNLSVQNQNNNDQEEILITWFSLFKLSSSLFLLVLVFISGMLLWKNTKNKVHFEDAPLSQNSVF